MKLSGFMFSSGNWNCENYFHYFQGEDFSNELPSSSSSSSSSLPSSPSQASSSPSAHKPPESSHLAQVGMPPNPSENLRLEVAAPHFHHNQLQVKVFWKWSHHGESVWSSELAEFTLVWTENPYLYILFSILQQGRDTEVLTFSGGIHIPALQMSQAQTEQQRWRYTLFLHGV